MTIQELKDRVAQLTQVRDQQIAQVNMVVGRLQESQERLALAEAKEAEAAKLAADAVAKAAEAALAPVPDSECQPEQAAA